MPPGADGTGDLGALVELHRELPAGLEVADVPMLRDDHLARARALWREAEEAPGAVRDPAVHRLADDPGDEQAALRLEHLGQLDPGEVPGAPALVAEADLIHGLLLGEGPRGHREVIERDAVLEQAGCCRLEPPEGLHCPHIHSRRLRQHLLQAGLRHGSVDSRPEGRRQFPREWFTPIGTSGG